MSVILILAPTLYVVEMNLHFSFLLTANVGTCYNNCMSIGNPWESPCAISIWGCSIKVHSFLDLTCTARTLELLELCSQK